MADLVESNIICFILNNIRVLLKSILIDLRARNFVQGKTSLRARSSPCPGIFFS